MIDTATFLIFVAASAAVIIVPGPTVTIIIANSLRAGMKAGLLNVAGTQVGLGIMLILLAFGFTTIVSKLAIVFDFIRVIGAAYLIWLGIKLIRSNGQIAEPDQHSNIDSDTGYFIQGLLVIFSNPKALFFYGAFLPQFVTNQTNPLPQIVLLGATFMVVGAIFDGAYAVAAGKLGRLLTRSKVNILEKISGACLISGAIWLLVANR